MKNIMEIIKAIENEKYRYFAIRADSRDYKSGEKMPNSVHPRDYLADMGESGENDIEIDGTCAYSVGGNWGEEPNEKDIAHAIKRTMELAAAHIYLIASNSHGEDIPESDDGGISLRNPIVICEI